MREHLRKIKNTALQLCEPRSAPPGGALPCKVVTMMISLTDAEMTAVMDAARPLRPSDPAQRWRARVRDTASYFEFAPMQLLAANINAFRLFDR